MRTWRGCLAAAALALALGAALSPASAHAQQAQSDDQIARQVGLVAALGTMRKRDRFGVPAEELKAWQEWAAFLFAEPDILPTLEAETRLGLAIAHYYAKQYEAGLAEAQAARAIALPPRHRTSLPTEIDAYTALLLMELGRLDEAEEMARAALLEAERSGLGGDLALALNARANLAYARNDLPAALEAFCGARDLGMADNWSDAGMVVTNASSCAVLNYFLETPETLPAVRLARDFATTYLPPDHPRMGNIYNTGYAILIRHGRYAEAQELVRKHLELERSLHAGDADDVFDPLSMLARTRERLGAHEDAADLFAAAADMAERLKSGGRPYIVGITRANEGQVLAKLGRLEEAESATRRGLARLRGDVAADDWHIGAAQVMLADILTAQGRPGEALVEVDAALALLRAKLRDDHSEVLTARLVKAQVLARLGEHDTAIAEAREAAAVLEGQMFDLAAGEQEQVALEAVLQPAFARYLDVTLRGEFAGDAVRAGQLQLLSSLAVTNARIAGARLAQEEGIASYLEQVEAAQSQVELAQFALFDAQASGESTGHSAKILAEARETLRLAEEALTGAYPDWARFTRPPLASLADLQAGLGEGEMLVLPLSLPDRAVTLAVTREAFGWGTSAVRSGELASLTAKIRRGIDVPETFDPADAQTLFAHVFPPELQPMLAQSDTLLFPASGYLARIPPGMLIAGESGDDLRDAPWLVRSHAITILASLYPRSERGGGARGASVTFLGIGAPGDTQPFRSDLPPLPRAAEELAALADAIGAGDPIVITGAEATERKFREAAAPRSAGVLAFATHGLVGGEVPGLSEPALLLAPDPEGAGGIGDGLLTASEISTMQLDADWVILSACNTAAGADGSAAAYSGLANAFAEAGARSLMLSHWRVRDDAAARLSVETLRRAAAGADRAGALREAQLALMADSTLADAAHPAIWAPFVIVEN